MAVPALLFLSCIFIVLLIVEWRARLGTGTVSLGLLATWIPGNEKGPMFGLQ